MPDRHASSGAVGAPAASARAAVRLSVLLPLPLAGVYDYLAPRGLALQPGDFVVVPLGNRQILGVAWGDAIGDVPAAKLKAVIERLPAPPMREELRRLIDWVASYTLAPAGAVLRMAMSVPDALEPARTLVGYALSDRGRAALAASPESLTAARRRVLEALAEGPPAPAADLARRAGCGAGVVRGLADLGHAERRATWRGVAEGRVTVVAGARSALFLPFADLGLIVVDEEHDASFKQEDGVIYHARDMAVVRASLAKLPIVLASATPSLETTINVEQQRYRRIHLLARHGAAQMPDISVYDLRLSRPEWQRYLYSPVVPHCAV